MNASARLDTRAAVRVLVADDEPAIRESYRSILKTPAVKNPAADLDDLRAKLFGVAPRESKPLENFDLTLCSGAEEAVYAVRDALADGRPFSVVFLDMRMPPGPDGLWAAIRIREIDPRVDIVVVTAYSDIDPEDISRQVPPASSLFYLQKPFHAQEIRQLAGALGRRRQAEDQIRRLAYYDDTTGLPNRIFFKERLANALESAERTQTQMALLFMDLDNFKRINDTLGHSIGDLLLNEVTKRLLQNLRANDLVGKGYPIDENQNLARLGGDEFTLILSGIRERSDAGLVAERLVKVLAEPLRLAGHDVIVTTSIGIAVFPDDGNDAETLLKNADSAMYCAKREGRNAYQYYSDAISAAEIKRLNMENHLRYALERGELSLHYQPQVDVASGAVSGAEALLRWSNPELGSVSPADFIPLAEETGLINSIGDWVLRSACTQAKKWRDAGYDLPRVAVNVSVHQFCQNGFAAHVGRILQETGLESSALEIEITESVLMKNGESAITTLQELKALGIQLAIDDFGVGYSSLAYLKQFPIDRLKIDRTFVCSLNTSPEEQAIVSAIIAMAGSLRLNVTAEGVETKLQMQFLKDRECDEAQGYYLSRPLPPPEAARFLKKKTGPAAES